MTQLNHPRGRPDAPAPVAVNTTGYCSAIELEELAGLIGVRVGAWNHFEYPEKTPAAGEHSADAVKAGHGAVEAIDALQRKLYRLREQLIGELRSDEDAHGVRVDAMLAEARARREDSR